MKQWETIAVFVAFATLVPSAVLASTGTCDMSAGDNGASETACIAAVQALGSNTVIDDIFKDSSGKTADQLPAYGQLVDPFGGCAEANTICNGDLTATQGTPTVNCVNSDHTFSTVANYVDNLDWLYANPVRLLDAHGTNGNCPTWGDQTTDGNKEGYKPWEGMVFDLLGPSNKVVLFPVNDHGPQPCESVEYTVYLTNNPASREMIDNPTTDGADPQKWNRAKLSQIYLEGWKKVRPGTDPNLDYTIEADSFASVWSLPCGITFRYVGVIAGNDGKDLPACNYDSFDAELDAVAGLTEQGAGVCPDADMDGYVDCNCSNAPVVCDCADDDPNVHPGAPEACDSPDVNCDGMPGGCADGQVCYQSICVKSCNSTGDVFTCPGGSACQQTASGPLCVPQDCSDVDCPDGSVCDPATKTCTPACDGVTCPHAQVCRNGACVDPCDGMQCPSPQICVDGACTPPCSCFNGDSACDNGDVCDRGGTDQCVPSACVNMSCMAGQYCNAQGQCAGLCDGVACPKGQKCVADMGGCVSNCTGVTCPAGKACNPPDGMCVDPACVNKSCPTGKTCVAGVCTGGNGNGTNNGFGFGTDGTNGTNGAGAGGASPGTKGCGCRVVHSPSSDGWLAALLLGSVVALVDRRRRTSL